MLSLIFAAVVSFQATTKLPEIGTWDGKAFAGILLGISENDLGRQVRKSKTVGPDPASVRVNVDRKNWILTAVLTGTNNKGHVCGFTLDMERNEPIESMEALTKELGNPDYTVFAPLRYTDWSLAVWESKGIAAAVDFGNRPRVMKVLLAEPAGLAKNLDLWDRSATKLSDMPKVGISGFDVNVTSDPHRREVEDEIDYRLHRQTRRLMNSDGGPSWYPANGSGSRVRVNFSAKRDRKITLNGDISVMYNGPSGYQTYSASTSDTFDHDRDLYDKVDSMFDSLMGRLTNELDTKFSRMAWQMEWRQFTNICKPKG